MNVTIKSSTNIAMTIIVFLIFFFFRVLSSIFLIFRKLTIHTIKITAISKIWTIFMASIGDSDLGDVNNSDG